MKTKCSIGFLFSVCVFICLADSPALPVPKTTTSLSKIYSFEMIPQKYHFEDSKLVIEEQAFGICSKTTADGKLKELWRTSGWYSFEVFLSDNGSHLVRMGPWNIGHQPSKDDLAVAFYENGSLLKEYSTADLIEDSEAVLVSTSHYQWLARDKEFQNSVLAGKTFQDSPESKLQLDSENIFHLRTVDGIDYKFDILTGEIVSKKRLEKD